MNRYLSLPATIVITAMGLVLGTAEAKSSLAKEARKVCLERYTFEKDGGTLPAGMPKSKYMSQCTRSFIRHAQLEEALKTAPETPPPRHEEPALGQNEITMNPQAARKPMTTRRSD